MLLLVIRAQQPHVLYNELTSGLQFYLFPLTPPSIPKNKGTEFTPQSKLQPTRNVLVFVGSTVMGLVFEVVRLRLFEDGQMMEKGSSDTVLNLS